MLTAAIDSTAGLSLAAAVLSNLVFNAPAVMLFIPLVAEGARQGRHLDPIYCFSGRASPWR